MDKVLPLGTTLNRLTKHFQSSEKISSILLDRCVQSGIKDLYHSASAKGLNRLLDAVKQNKQNSLAKKLVDFLPNYVTGGNGTWFTYHESLGRFSLSGIMACDVKAKLADNEKRYITENFSEFCAKQYQPPKKEATPLQLFNKALNQGYSVVRALEDLELDAQAKAILIILDGLKARTL